MYYGLFVRVGHRLIRVDTTTGYTIDTAKRMIAPLIATLTAKGLRTQLRELPPVKQIVVNQKDKRYAKTPW